MEIFQIRDVLSVHQRLLEVFVSQTNFCICTEPESKSKVISSLWSADCREITRTQYDHLSFTFIFNTSFIFCLNQVDLASSILGNQMTRKVSHLYKGILLTQLNQEPLLPNDINIQTMHSLLRQHIISGELWGRLRAHLFAGGCQKCYKTILLLFPHSNTCRNFGYFCWM